MIVQTGNGPLDLAAGTMRGERVDIGELLPIEPSDGYTHVVSYSGVRSDGIGISGSAEVRADGAETIRAFLARRAGGAS